MLNLPLLTALLLTSSSTALAASGTAAHIPGLVTRQTTDCNAFGKKACGAFCIPPDYECCEAIQAGCRPGTYCDGLGCCPDGKICSGGGGIDEGTLTRTLTNTLTGTATPTPTATATGGGEDGETISTTRTSSSVPVIQTSTPSSGGVPGSSTSCSASGSPTSAGGNGSGSVNPSHPGTPSSSSPPVYTGAAGSLDVERGFCAIAGLLAGAALL